MNAVMLGVLLAAAGTHPQVVQRKVVVDDVVDQEVRYLVGNPNHDLIRELIDAKVEAAVQRALGAAGAQRSITETIHEQRCTRCHLRGSSQTQGAPTWSRELTSREITDALAAMLAGRMPPNGQLSDQDGSAILQSFISHRNDNQEDNPWSRRSSPPPQPQPPLSAEDLWPQIEQKLQTFLREELTSALEAVSRTSETSTDEASSDAETSTAP